MNHSPAIRRLLAVAVAAVALLVAGCAYYNTFYNAKGSYREGMKLKEQSQQTQAKAKFDKAIEKSAYVIKRWPKSQWVDDALLLIGNSYFQEGYYGKASTHYEQLTLAFPGSPFVPEAALGRGRALLGDKQYGEGRVALDEVRVKYPRLADDATFYLARSFFDREEFERAADSLAAFNARYPKSRFRRDATRYLAEASFSLERYADAEKAYTEYVRITSDPKERAQAMLKVATCMYKQGRLADAAKQVRDVLGRYAELDDEANLLMGKVMSETGKPQEAASSWAKVRGSNDYGAEAAFLIGKQNEEHGELVKASAYYDTARTRKANSDYGVLAVKRLALLDALAARTSGKKAGAAGDTMTAAEAMFLVAEVSNLNLGEYDKALDLYQKVYDSFPTSDWAAKALFAEAWIFRYPKQDSSAAVPLLKKIVAEFPETEYADESRRWMGLPVPKRKPKEVKPESVAVKPDTLKPAPRGGTLPPSQLPDTGALAGHGPRDFPPGTRPPARPGEVVDPMTGATVIQPPGAGIEPPRPIEQPGTPPRSIMPGEEAPPPPPPVPVVTADTARPTPPVAKADTVVKPLPATPPVTESKPETPTAPRLAFARVHFGTDSADVRPGEADSLELNLRLLRENPGVKVTLTGYCDPRASESHNTELGLRRAQAVKDFLVEVGISADRISVRSRGEKDIVSTRPDEYWLDRRVEFGQR